jgi:ribosomal protein S18 acetylase RimI-like enzyme
MMFIRPFRLSDTLPLIHMWEEVLPQESEALELMTRQLSEDSTLVLVAESNHQIVGMIVGAVVGNEACVHRIAVQPSFRGRGIGKGLLKELEQRCTHRGISKLYCSIDTYNEKALAFYQAMGLDRYPEKVG